jgi:amidophosphoribosyltransferase
VCSVWGAQGPSSPAARTVFYGIFALQHRGQESTGIATLGDVMHLHRGMGLVTQVYTEEVMRHLSGSAGIGHTRYSTAGSSHLTNAQPFCIETDLGQIAMAHNGQLTRAKSLRKQILRRGTGLHSTTDSELIVQMLAHPFKSLDRLSPIHLEYDSAGAASGAHSSPVVLALSGDDGGPDDEDDDRHGRGAAAGGGGAAEAGAAVQAAAAASTASTAAAGEAEEEPRDWMRTWEGRLSWFVREAEGAYAFALLTRAGLFGVRDRYGLRPLCIGKREEADGRVTWMLSSESCSLTTVGAEFVREVRPGEIVRINDEGVSTMQALPREEQASVKPALCVMELVYFARPDSYLGPPRLAPTSPAAALARARAGGPSSLVHAVRQRLGAQLASEAGVPDADFVAPVPDSGTGAAIGFARRAGLPLQEVLCKNRYVQRTFIEPSPELRKRAVQLKFNLLQDNVAGKSVVLVDDSLVRGSTLQQLIPLIRKGGARAIHVRISSPPIRHPCFMGISIGTYEELVAHTFETVDQVCAFIGADSLAYLSLDGMMAAVRGDDPDSLHLKPTAVGAHAILADATHSDEDHGARSGHCTACFSGHYPLPRDEW